MQFQPLAFLSCGIYVGDKFEFKRWKSIFPKFFVILIYLGGELAFDDCFRPVYGGMLPAHVAGICEYNIALKLLDQPTSYLGNKQEKTDGVSNKTWC